MYLSNFLIVSAWMSGLSCSKSTVRDRILGRTLFAAFAFGTSAFLSIEPIGQYPGSYTLSHFWHRLVEPNYGEECSIAEFLGAGT